MQSRLLAVGRSSLKFPGTKVEPGNLFDADWYVRNNDVTTTPSKAWSHFCSVGWRAGANPCAGFDTRWYLGAYPDVVARGINPLLHYITEGHLTDYFPHPLFDTKHYREQNPDVASANLNPLSHYLEDGFREGRQPIDLFEDYWYLSQYKDVARARLLPIYHYAKCGAFEGRNPSPHFDTEFYVKHNADVPFHAINPLYHYVKHGRVEGRSSKTMRRDVYLEWIDRNETSGFVARQHARATLNLFKYLPKFSIAVPTYNTPILYLNEFIESVIDQSYPFWELCIVDDASTMPHVRAELEKYAQHPRIKIAYNTENMHIAGATNEALKLATGDFICLMDHDDLISDNALYEFALKLNIDPSLDMIYSDEDKMSMSGERYDPFFKPDWSPEYLESCMYTSHFACYRRSIVGKVGGFRAECNGAQDYDFVLRFVQETQRIGHVAKILYHWRAIPGSTAQSMDNKDYVIGAAVRALEDYLEREKSPGTVRAGRYGGSFDVVRAVKGSPKVSIVIPTSGKPATIRGQSVNLIVNCIESIATSTYKNIEILVVHDGPPALDTVQAVADRSVRFIEYSEPFNFARKMNCGAQAASGEFLLFLNDDTEVIAPDWIETMLAVGQKPGVGCVGAKLLFESGQIQHIGVTFADGMPDHVLRGAGRDDPGYVLSAVACRNWLAVTAACMLCRKDVFNSVGGFDEAFAINYNDVDLCLKIVERGLRCVFTPHALLYHFESQSRARTVSAEEITLFRERWSKLRRPDPFYSMNFEARPPDFKIKVEHTGIDDYDGSDLIRPLVVAHETSDTADELPTSLFSRLFRPFGGKQPKRGSASSDAAAKQRRVAAE